MIYTYSYNGSWHTKFSSDVRQNYISSVGMNNITKHNKTSLENNAKYMLKRAYCINTITNLQGRLVQVY